MKDRSIYLSICSIYLFSMFDLALEVMKKSAQVNHQTQP